MTLVPQMGYISDKGTDSGISGFYGAIGME
jgi:hypothetical protein